MSPKPVIPAVRRDFDAISGNTPSHPEEGAVSRLHESAPLNLKRDLAREGNNMFLNLQGFTRALVHSANGKRSLGSQSLPTSAQKRQSLAPGQSKATAALAASSSVAVTQAQILEEVSS